MFRVLFYDTQDDHKYQASNENIHEYLCNRQDALSLWYLLTRILNKKHVEIYDLAGMRQQPEKGLGGLSSAGF